jgi:aminopeptidase YwaD
MRMLKLPALVCLFVSVTASAQHLVPQKTFDAIATEYSGEAAQENTRRIVEYHRIQGSPMMSAVAEQVVLPRLKAAGLEAAIEQFPSDGKIRYGTYISPMGWDMRGGELWVEKVTGLKNFQPLMLCRYADVPMCVSTYSKGGEWTGDLVDVGSGTSDADYKSADVRGKVALASGYAANIVRQAVIKHGAVGVVIYPSASDRPDHPDMIRYNGIWPRAEELDKTSSGFQISRNQYDVLKALMKQGAVHVHGKIDATLAPGKLTLVHAYIRGTEQPEREIIISGHLDHPKWSANDNASGSGAMMEAARTLQKLIADKKLAPPKITIHFMWVPEYFGTLAYVTNHPEVRSCFAESSDPRPDARKATTRPSCVTANINLDMVGEDTVKTNSRFYFTKAPDSVSSSLDGLLADAAAQTREADLYAQTGTRNYWLPEAIPYAQGSDHDVFLGLGIPSTMFGHDPDWTHHTSEDKIDKTDATEFRRVGALASAVAYWEAATEQASISPSGTWNNNMVQIVATGAASRISDLLLRRIKDSGSGQVAARRDRQNGNQLHDLLTLFAIPERPRAPDPERTGGPHRLTLLPLDASAFENASPDDAKWLAEQEARFASDSEGLATKPNFGLISFEAINFMDGHRSTSEIADLVAAEYLIDIDQAWVDRLVNILEKQQLVGK